jgi:hypothetical protein
MIPWLRYTFGDNSDLGRGPRVMVVDVTFA